MNGKQMGPAPKNPLRRFEQFLVYTGDCIMWSGGVSKGYGRFGYDRKVWLAHKWIYEQTYGPVPKGLELDHLCRNRGCVNVGHLETVTRGVNIARGRRAMLEGMRLRVRRRTHCKNGHAYTVDGGLATDMRGYTFRSCLACHRAYQIAYTERKKEQVK